MMQQSLLRYMIFMMLGSLSIFLSGCLPDNENARNAFGQFEQIKAAHKELEKETTYQTVKNYFSSISEVEKILGTRELRDLLRRDPSKVSTLCREAFLPISEWRVLWSGCFYHQFFVCPEEIKNYPRVADNIVQWLHDEAGSSVASNCASTLGL